MAGSDERLEAIASDILDGAAIDWNSAESSVDSAHFPIVEQLQVVAAVANLHRVPAAWGSLRILERIGRGTFGDVYRAWDARLDREVALKLIPAEAARAGTSVIHEGRLLARVRHNNVVTIHGAEQIGDAIGIWMELVRGQTLAQLLHGGGLLAPDDATRIVIDLCHAVSAVHDAGLLHRDIKAHNVMLGHDGRVVLMDFGTGRELTDQRPPISLGRRSMWRLKCSTGVRRRPRATCTASASCCSISSPERTRTGADDRRDSRGACRTVDIARARAASRPADASRDGDRASARTRSGQAVCQRSGFCRCALGSGGWHATGTVSL